MLIYHLIVNVHTNKYGDLWEAYSGFTDVFSTLDSAVEIGTIQVKERIDELLKKDVDYKENQLEDFINEVIEYKFEVHEFDPAKRDEEFLRTDTENMTIENSVEYAQRIMWDYDYRGILRSRWECRGIDYHIMPSDYQEDAGSIFKPGDLVICKNNPDRYENPSGIYVITSSPGHRVNAKKPLLWENIYTIEYLYCNDKYSSMFHTHAHELDLEAFQGAGQSLPLFSFINTNNLFKIFWI